MHPRTSWIVFGLIAAIAAQAGTIYKWVDAQGVVHYSDQYQPGAQKIETSGSISTYSGAAAAAGGATRPPGAPQQRNAGQSGYELVALSAPAPEQSFFGDNPVTGALALSPGLQPGHTITWKLNGAPVPDQPPTATQVSLTGLARGQYSLSATITDPGTGQTWNADAVTFYVRQPSALSPQAHHN